jgi:hypothetical protein
MGTYCLLVVLYFLLLSTVLLVEEERLEDDSTVFKVVSDNVDEIVLVHRLLDECTRSGALGVEVGPLASEFERLVLPGNEGNSLDNRGLHNLFAGEDAPGDRVGAFRVGVGTEAALLVDSVVGDRGVRLDAADELVEELRRDEELEVGLGEC